MSSHWPGTIIGTSDIKGTQPTPCPGRLQNGGGWQSDFLCLWCLRKLAQSTRWPQPHTGSSMRTSLPKHDQEQELKAKSSCSVLHQTGHFGKWGSELWLKSEAATNTINCILSSELNVPSSFRKHLWILTVYQALQ